MNVFPHLVPNSTSFPQREHLVVPSDILVFKRHRFCVHSVLFFLTICGEFVILYIYININDQDYTQQTKSGILFSMDNLRCFSRVI